MKTPISVCPIRLGAVILGAGRSTRMGAAKLLLPWGKTSVVGHLIGEWRRLNAGQIVVVCAQGDQAMQAELTRLSFPEVNRILNTKPERGMFSSIQCAAEWQGWVPSLTHWAIVLGDQPHLGQGTLRALLDFCVGRPESVCQPRYAGHRHHPVIVPRAAFSRLASSQAGSLKGFLNTEAAETQFCDLNDPSLELDIDRPEDYQRALAILNGAPFNSSL